MVSFTLLKFFFKNNCVVFDDFIILSTLEFKVNNFFKTFCVHNPLLFQRVYCLTQELILPAFQNKST